MTKLKDRKIGQRWQTLSLKSKLLSISGLCAAGLAILAFAEHGLGIMSEIRPWAARDTEIVVAGWQADRTDNTVRDIESRIFRLETRLKTDSRNFTQQDRAELDYWHGELRKKRQVLNEIQQYKRPVVER